MKQPVGAFTNLMRELKGHYMHANVVMHTLSNLVLTDPQTGSTFGKKSKYSVAQSILIIDIKLNSF